MGCCDQKRQVLKSSMKTTSAASTAPPVIRVRPPGERAPVNPTPRSQTGMRYPSTLEYLATAHITVQGPITGNTYEVSYLKPNVVVEAADATALIGTGLFRRRRA